jgi:hypothetical protein
MYIKLHDEPCYDCQQDDQEADMEPEYRLAKYGKTNSGIPSLYCRECGAFVDEQATAIHSAWHDKISTILQQDRPEVD